ncbi:hypothetical protein KCU93_g4548, partial [Aureobasidium melanogenum]
MSQFEGKSDGASLALVPQSAARLSLVRSDGNSNPIAPDVYLGPSMTSVSLSLSLLTDAMAFGVQDTLHIMHDSQPALKSHMKVDDQLRALSVTQPSLKRIFRSNRPLAILSSYLDSVDRQHVILKLAAFNNFTTLNAYLSGNATHNKKISQFFDLVDAGPAPTFCTLYPLCLGHVSAEPTQSSAPSTLPSLSPRRLTGIQNTSSALHCLKLLSGFGEHVSSAFDRDDFPKFVEAVFNSVVGPAELLYDHLVKECSTVTLYADNSLVYTNLSQKFNSQDMRICKSRNKAADLSIMPKLTTAEEALLCTSAVYNPLKQLPKGTTQDGISPLLKRTQHEYEAQMARPPPTPG